MSINYSGLNIFYKIILTTLTIFVCSLNKMEASTISFQQDVGVVAVPQNEPSHMEGTLCNPIFSFNHLTFNCLETLALDQLPFPNVYSECGNIVDIDYSDEYFDLGCFVDGFTGWFQKDNWIQSKIKGDGGVDVTGAPNALLVEGANKALVEVMPGSITSFTVVVPADGFIAFDWSIVGGSNLSLTVRAGESTIVPDRYFVSQSLKAGDSFSLLFQSTFQGQAGTIELSNFQFLSNINTVIERTWTAEDEHGNRIDTVQFIGIKGIEANQILMPLDLKTSKAAYREALPGPEQTGYPIFDKDGDWLTTDDQIDLQGRSCSVKMSWTDELKEGENETLIKRKWVIEQGCGRNTIIHTQEIVLDQKISQQIQPSRKGIGSSEKNQGLRDDSSTKTKNYYSYISEEDSFDSHQ